MPARTAILDLEEHFMRCYDARDFKNLVLGFYAENAQLLPPGGPPVVGHYPIQHALEKLLEQGVRSINLETHHMDEYGDLAYNIGRFTLDIHSSEGHELEDTGKYLVVYRRQMSGGWLAVADMFNSDHA